MTNDKAIEAAVIAHQEYEGHDTEGAMRAAVTAYEKNLWQEPVDYEYDGSEVIAWVKSDAFKDEAVPLFYEEFDGWCWPDGMPCDAKVHKVRMYPEIPTSEVEDDV